MKTVTLNNPVFSPETASSQALIHRLSLLEEEYKKTQEELDRAYQIIRLLQQKRFGRKSEKLDIELPMLPGFEDFFDEAGIEPANEPEGETPEQTAEQDKTKKQKKPGRRPLPKDLPRERVIHDLPEEEKQCQCCGHQMVKFGEETSEQLDYIPAQIKVLVHVRNKYACRACEEGVTLAPLPAQPIAKSIASASLLAHVLVSKFADHLPLYRQSEMWDRLGVDISRATMSGWVLRCGTMLAPLVELLRQNIINSDYVRADETPLQVLSEPGRNATDKSYMWVFMNEATEHKSIVYRYAPTRKGAVAEEFLTGFQGHLQTDDYSGYHALCRKPGVIAVGCSAHARRKFTDIVKIVKTPGKAAEALAFIGKLYEIERYAKDHNFPSDKVKELRQKKAKPIWDAYKIWLKNHIGRVPPKNPLCAAMKYTVSNWPQLTRYLEDGRLDIDNNAMERMVKPFATGRKNWLFAGNEVGAHASAIIYSLIETCEANDVEPEAYLKHVLENIHTTQDLSQLLPFHLKSSKNKIQLP